MGDRLRDGGPFTLTGAGPAVPDDAVARLRFIKAETRLMPVPAIPEIRLWQADDATLLWQRSADEIGSMLAALPFWAFAWSGGRGLARHVLDHPELVRGKRVLDFAAGSGLVGIAAALSGAASVSAAEIDDHAVAAIALNAAENGVEITTLAGDIVGTDIAADLVLAGDIFYDRAMTAAVLPWLRRLSATGIEVVAGDPGRSYRPAGGTVVRASVTVPAEPALEDAAEKTVRILSILPD